VQQSFALCPLRQRRRHFTAPNSSDHHCRSQQDHISSHIPELYARHAPSPFHCPHKSKPAAQTVRVFILSVYTSRRTDAVGCPSLLAQRATDLLEESLR
jgi:hypothetical protein